MSTEKSINQTDVAKKAGVSRSVVSYVLNNGPRKVSKETRQRVLDAIEELGYRPNEHAQRLKQGFDVAQNSIGIVTGGVGYNLLERPYYNVILSGLYEAAYEYNQQISFIAYWDALKDPIFFNKHVHPEEISSLIFMLPSFIPKDEPDQKLLQEIISRIPNIICLEDAVMDLPSVAFDRAQAARIVTEHLIKLGHERIAFVAINDQRIIGYKQALLEHNIAFDAGLIQFPDSAPNPVTGAYNLVSRMIETRQQFSAIFAANDESAIAAIAAVKDHGLRVPEDIAVASIDNIEIADMIRPSLTTIDVPKRSLAKLAIQALQTLQEHDLDTPMSIMVPTKLIVRDSCGASSLGTDE